MKFEEEEALSAVLKAMAREMDSRQAPPRVEERLRAAFRARRRAQAIRRWWWVPALATAAVVLLVLSFASRPGPAPQLPGLKAALRFAPAAPVVKLQPVTAKYVRRRMPPRRLAPLVEVATDFFPFRPGVSVDRAELLEVVRIAVPSSEMLRFGLPVGLNPVGRAVMADVIIGEDGLAKAIRFVR